MQQHNLPQGSAEWHAHRAQHDNASDAPAMLGCSPYQTRAELLRRRATGLSPEVDAGTQRIFDNGHRFEALARPLAEEIIGEGLAPVVGALGKLSASFDGLTLMGDVAFEHKTLNADLRGCMGPSCIGRDLPKHYRVQMEQQLHVSGAERVLFMASEWTADGTLVEVRHCWYEPDAELRAEILRGWEQFRRDLAAYEAPAAAGPVVVAAPVQALPAVSVVVDGTIAIRHNLPAFEVALRDFLEHRLIRAPKTDQDFADLDVQIKAMKGAEAMLESAESNWTAQVDAVATAKRQKDMLLKLTRDNRLMAEKLLASEKERRKGDIVAVGVKALADHIAALNKRLGKPYMPTVPADFGGCIRGMKSLASMEDKVAGELARGKIAANDVADRIQANLATLRELAAEHTFLFADTPALVLKDADDCRAVVTSRITEHKAAEEKRLEAERARIRAEEEARAQRQAEERAAAERRQQEEEQRLKNRPALLERAREIVADLETADVLRDAIAAAPCAERLNPASGYPSAANVLPMPTRAPAGPPTLTLGEIKKRIAPLSIDDAGLTALGFPPAGREGAAKLRHEADWPRICAAIVSHIERAKLQQRAA